MTGLPENYNIDNYDRPSVAVDVVAFTIRKKAVESYRHLADTALSVLLVQRNEEPYKGWMSLPGGFTVRTETVEETALRKLSEKTGIGKLPLSLLHNFSDPGRDPRGWIISCGYWTVVEYSNVSKIDENAAWYDVKFTDGKDCCLELTSDTGNVVSARIRRYGQTELYNEAEKIEITDSCGLAFDHAKIIVSALLQLRSNLEKPYAAFRLLPEYFTLTDLQKVYEIIMDKSLLSANFRRKIMQYVEETELVESGAGHRPSKLYKAKKERL